MTVAVVTNDASPHTGYFAFETTRNPEDGMSAIVRCMGYYYTYADQTASTVKCIVPPGSRVIQVAHEVHTAFTSVTAMIVGDGDDDNGWIASGVISPTASSPEFVFDYDADLAVKGKLYMSGDTIDIKLTGIATAGSGILWVMVISYAEAANAEA